jgi:hypothetical protein
LGAGIKTRLVGLKEALKGHLGAGIKTRLVGLKVDVDVQILVSSAMRASLGLFGCRY